MKRLMYLLLGLLCAWNCLGADDEFVFPRLRVPKFSESPKIDGRIDKVEWFKSASFTGVAAVGSGVGPYSMVPQVQQVVWHIGYDDNYLYLAMHSPHPKGTFPVTKVKTPDDSYNILFEDHTEIQICVHEAEKACTPPFGFYKIMTNAKDVVSDTHEYNGTIGTEGLWDYGGRVKSNVTNETWDMEMAISLKHMKLDSLDGKTLIMQLVRADASGGMYFAGWVPAGWTSWGIFARVTFDPDAPLISFEKLGEVMSGNLDAEVGLDSGKLSREINVNLKVDNAEGKPLFSEKKMVTLKAGESTVLTWKADNLPVSEVDVNDARRRNWFEILATYKDGTENRILYQNRLPFMKFNSEFREKFLDPWIKLRPKSGEWTANIANMPYAGKLEATVDLDFFGLDPAIQNAASFNCKIKGSGKEIASAKGEINDYRSKPVLMDMPDLPDGGYEAVFTLLDSAGKPIAEQTKTFSRKHYPWEHNTLGISDEVIPPYLPMRTDPEKRTVTVWGRTLTLDKSGLIEQALIGPPTGTFGVPEPLLQSPMRLEVAIDGKPVVGEGKNLEFSSTTPSRVEFSGNTKLGPLIAKLKGFIEYDGWYQAELTFVGSATVDSLDLVIDFRDSHATADKPAYPVDTLYVQRQGGARYGNCLEGIPKKNGVIFRSTELLKTGMSTSKDGKDWKSFVPNVLLGNGDRALQFHAWSDLGWKTSDEDAAVTVERLNDRTVRLKIRFIAGQTKIVNRPPISFGFQFLPVKPNHPRYRTIGRESAYYQDTSGYRYYGDSVDGYALHSDEDYDALRRFLLYGPVDMGQKDKSEKIYQSGHSLERHKLIRNGSKIVMYGSGMLMGMGMEEFKTFGGEWLGSNNWKPLRDAVGNIGWWNYGGTIQWNSDEQITVTVPNWTKSMTDNFLWYYKSLIEKCGFNGTWWDNSNLWTIREYDPTVGKIIEKWNILQRRELCKRLNVMGWKLMRPPAWSQHAHTDYAWNQFFWMVEGDYYADNKDMTAMDQMTMDEWRAMTRTRSTMLVPAPCLRNYEGTTYEMDRKIWRSVVGVCLSHDVMAGPVCTKTRPTDVFIEIGRLLTFAVDMPDTENCLFRGYWRTSDAIQPAGKDIYASIFHNAKRKTAVAVLLNGLKGKDQTLGGTTFDPVKMMGMGNKAVNVKRLYDLESGKDIAFNVDNGAYKIVDTLFIPWHDYRLLALEVD